MDGKTRDRLSVNYIHKIYFYIIIIFFPQLLKPALPCFSIDKKSKLNSHK